MSGYRSLHIGFLALLVTFVGCQTDSGNRTAWNPFQKKKPIDAVAETEPQSAFSMSRFTRRKEDSSTDDSKTAGTPMAAEQLERLLTEGRIALQENRLDDAKKVYSEILKSVPDDSTAHHGLAMAADLGEKWDDAEYHYRQALRLRPKDPDLLCDIGYSYLLQSRYSESERYLTYALEVSPQHESALMNLAMLDLRQGKRAAAEQRLVDRYGTQGKINMVLSQLEEQVSSMRGGILTASATNVPAPETAKDIRPDGSINRMLPTEQGLPEIPPTASLEEALAIARREGAEAERQRLLQSMSAESAQNIGAGAAKHRPVQQPGNWPGSLGTAVMPASPNRPNLMPGGTAGRPASNSNPPQSIFGTLKPRNAQGTNGGQNLSAVAADLSYSIDDNSQIQGGDTSMSVFADDANLQPKSQPPQDLPVGANSQNQGHQNNSTSKSALTNQSGFGSTTQDPQGGLSGNSMPGNSNVANSIMGLAGNTPAGGQQNSGGPLHSTPGGTSASNGEGQGGQNSSPLSTMNSNAPVAVRSTGAFQNAGNASTSYGMPYGFASGSEQPSTGGVSNNNAPGGLGMTNGSNAVSAEVPAHGMYLDGLNVGPGSLFPVAANGSIDRTTPHPQGANRIETSPVSMYNDSSGMRGASGSPQFGNAAGSRADTSPLNSRLPNGGLRMGNISSPGSGSMINGAMYSQPDSTLPSAGVFTGGGINSTSNLPGWPGSRPTQANPLESYERQRQQLDDEYNRTLEQLDRNNPNSSSRAQY